MATKGAVAHSTHFYLPIPYLLKDSPGTSCPKGTASAISDTGSLQNCVITALYGSFYVFSVPLLDDDFLELPAPKPG